jgi:hypothetical protein
MSQATTAPLLDAQEHRNILYENKIFKGFRAWTDKKNLKNEKKHFRTYFIKSFISKSYHTKDSGSGSLNMYKHQIWTKSI